MKQKDRTWRKYLKQVPSDTRIRDLSQRLEEIRKEELKSLHQKISLQEEILKDKKEIDIPPLNDPLILYVEGIKGQTTRLLLSPKKKRDIEKKCKRYITSGTQAGIEDKMENLVKFYQGGKKLEQDASKQISDLESVMFQESTSKSQRLRIKKSVLSYEDKLKIKSPYNYISKIINHELEKDNIFDIFNRIEKTKELDTILSDQRFPLLIKQLKARQKFKIL